MKRGLLFMYLFLVLLAYDAQAQRKGLNFSKEAYERVPLAEEEALGYTDEDLPAYISHKAYAPYPGNQGDYGTCVGWSSAYGALTIEYAKRMGMTDRDQITFSAFCPYYLYNQFKPDYDFFCQEGGFFEDALEIIYSVGAKRYFLPEYSCYSDYEELSMANASNFRIKDYFRLFDWSQSEFDKALGLESTRVQNIKKALANGHPVLIGMYVPSSFDYVVGKELWAPTQAERDTYNEHAGHAMTIVGYDDNKYGGAFEVMNSWGRDWGNDGFVWITYDDMDLFGHTAFYMDPGYQYVAGTGCQFGDCNSNYSRYKFATGEIYEGELASGFFHGQGLYLYSDGGAYAGQWKDGFKNGKGTLLYANGTTLSGYWKDNIYFGTTEPEYETEVADVTEVKDDVQEDTTEDWDDYDWSYLWDDIWFDETEEETEPTTGCVSGDCENGFGKFIYSDGDVYEGYFSSTYRHGYGTYDYIEGDRYEGMWSWGNREGMGYYIWPSGNEYIGFWSANQQNGKGTKYFTDGNIDAGEWVGGVFQQPAGFGFAGAEDPEKTESEVQQGLYFSRAKDGKVVMPKYSQIPMKQGFGGIPTNGLGMPMEDPYRKMADKVVKDLLKGIGKTDLTNPEVHILNSNRDVAYTTQNGIHVSTRFIDLCRSFGKDSLSALSVVLAHELGHYFNNHFFCRDFGYAYGEMEWGKQLSESFEEIFETGYFETEADEFGLFFSFISGYDPFSVAEEVIGKVYENFNLPENLKGYPPKSARQEQVRLAQKNVQQLIPLFEVGNLMSALATATDGETRKSLLNNAIQCYEHIIDQKITTAEMYNNLGVNYLTMALEAVDTEDFPFGLPMELDFSSRLYASQGGTKGDLGYTDDPLFAENVQQAIAFFRKAMELDEAYIPAYTNASSAYLLLGDTDEAWVLARKARRAANDQNNSLALRNSLDLLALVAWQNGEPEDANEFWDEAISMDSPLARHNKAATTGPAGNDGWFDVPAYSRPSFSEIEKIDGNTLYDMGSEYLYNGKPIETFSLKGQQAMVGKTAYGDGTFFIYVEMDRSRMKDSYYFYFVDGASTRRSSLNIGNGSQTADITKAYGKPVSVISAATHSLWVYTGKNVIFKIDGNDHVDGWIVYDVNL